jgi:hypothetical protein
MQRLLSEDTNKRALLTSGAGMVWSNLRYITWFYVLNLVLAWLGSLAFATQVHSTLDHSLYSDRLLHGFDLAVFFEMLAKPEFGPLLPSTVAASCFAFVFLLATALFLPGVFQGYASTYRLPGEEFFRACGRNLWRFIRLMIVAGIVMGIIAAALFAIRDAIVKKASDSTNELLHVYVSITSLALIFLIMMILRIWFDLAEADVVLSDQRAVRKSIRLGFRHAFRSCVRLLASYVFITIVAAVILGGGLFLWINYVAPDNILQAFLVGQLTLLLLLIPRFWQRGVAVSYYQQHMMVPVVAVEPIGPEIVPGPVVIEPVAAPGMPGTPTGTEGAV